MQEKTPLIDRTRIAGMNCHYRYYRIEDFFASLQKNEISKAELWTCASHYMVDHTGYQDTAELKKKAESFGIDIICLTPEQNNPKPYNFAAESKILIERNKAYYKNVIQAAQELDCRLISVSSGWAFYSEPVSEAWKRAVEMFQELCGYAADHSVLLAMETLYPQETRLVNERFSLARMIAEVGSEALKVNLDLGSIGVAGEQIEQYFEMFGTDIVHCHFVDGNPAGHLAWGEGTRNVKNDLSDLCRCGYQGDLSLELVNAAYFEEPEQADRKCIGQLSPYFK